MTAAVEPIVTDRYVILGGVKYLKADNEQLRAEQRVDHPCAYCCARHNERLCDVLCQYCDADSRIIFVRATR